ncbi:MAG TPA: zinc-binding dehydrogenase [Ktedonobacteraceae bacterium]
MSTVQAVLVDPNVAGRLALRPVDQPQARPSEAIIRVGAISLNRGEINRALAADAGWRPGWDIAGVVEQAAADGTGPKQGARVVGFLAASAGWAELVAVPTDCLAELPANVSLAQAATLPVAGLTALYVLEKGGSLLGKNVLVTGASGGAGHLACQIAVQAGAKQVIGVVRQVQYVQSVRETGAEVIVSDDGKAAAQYGPYDVIAESVGGQVLGNVMGMVAKEGICVNFGNSATPEVTFNLRNFFPIGGVKLYGFILFHEVKYESAASGLSRLVSLVSDGKLIPPISVEQPWEHIAEVAQQLIARRFVGKAVLTVNPDLK